MQPYTIVRSAQQRTIRIALAGMWDKAVVEANGRDVDDAEKSLSGAGGVRILRAASIRAEDAASEAGKF